MDLFNLFYGLFQAEPLFLFFRNWIVQVMTVGNLSDEWFDISICDNAEYISP